MDIEKNINMFLVGKGKNKGRKPDERYASFDYCYNYFYSFYKVDKIKELASDDNILMSCLQIGFYLASWGMMRGSSFLLEKSVLHYSKLIKTISQMDPVLWEIDTDKYDARNIERLIECKDFIIEALKTEEKTPTDTLVTKIMLGVFANTPAFDSYFNKSFKVYKFNEKSLIKIKDFYLKNKDVIDSYEIFTYEFSPFNEINENETTIQYTKAKLIDMCGFMDGQ